MKDFLEILKCKDIEYTVTNEGVYIPGDAILYYTAITALPEGLSVGHSLYLEGTAITTLPEGLSVGHSLNLEGTAITALPDNFSCNSLYLNPERVSNVAYRDNCGHLNRTIFAAWNGTEFRIAAGCFFGNAYDFECAVDNKYSGDAAETYKRMGRECIAELTEKLNGAAIS